MQEKIENPNSPEATEQTDFISHTHLTGEAVGTGFSGEFSRALRAKLCQSSTNAPRKQRTEHIPFFYEGNVTGKPKPEKSITKEKKQRKETQRSTTAQYHS